MEERGGREGKDIQTLGKRISPDAAANKTTAAAARCSDRWEWRKGGVNLSIPCMRKPILLLSPSTGEGRGDDPSSKGLLSLQGPFLSLSPPFYLSLLLFLSLLARETEREGKRERISCFGLFLPLPLFLGGRFRVSVDPRGGAKCSLSLCLMGNFWHATNGEGGAGAAAVMWGPKMICLDRVHIPTYWRM